ncbi:MAG: hypothetical protein WCN88_03875 [Candidatus Falkowbacteria bacterium]
MENNEEILIQAKKVLAFFDLFDHPLSAFEIWKYSGKQTELVKIKTLLETENSFIGAKNGLFFLAGREEIIANRAHRYNYSNRKLKSAQRFIKLFKWLPFIKAIALANSIGSHNLRDGSDIDIFVICAPRRIWLTRLIMASAAKFLNRRPTARNKRDKICLSFYITTKHLNLDSLKLETDDPYFYYWLRSLILLYNKDGAYERFLEANNVIKERPVDLSLEKSLDRNKLESIILNFFETLSKKIQFKIMSPALKQAMNNSTGVVVNDEVLKLYLTDNRQEYAEKYGNKIREIFKESN